MEIQSWKAEFSSIRAHAGHHGKELADQLAKEAVNSKNINEGYNRIPKSAELCELNEQIVIHWQSGWDRSLKGTITKSFFPKIADTLKLRINATPNFTAIVTGHGNIKISLYKYKIIDSPVCSCENGEQSVDDILFDCKLLQHDRDRPKAAVLRSEN
jgi:hypothetical protein